MSAKDIFAHIDERWRKVLIHDPKELGDILHKINGVLKDKSIMTTPKIEHIFHNFRLLNDFKYIIIGPEPVTEIINEVPVADGIPFTGHELYDELIETLVSYALIDHKTTTNSLAMYIDHSVFIFSPYVITFIDLFGREVESAAIKEIHDRLTKYMYIILVKLLEYKPLVIDYANILDAVNNLYNKLPIINDVKIYDKESGIDAIIEEHTQMSWNPDNNIKIFTDGSSLLKEDLAGWAFYCSRRNSLTYGKVTIGRATNQRAEGYAILNALLYIIENRIFFPITIVTDSQFYINVITKWMHSWVKFDKTFTKKNQGSELANGDLIKLIYENYMIVTKYCNITFMHIRSHEQAPADTESPEYELWYGNYLVDKYAGMGRILNGVKTIEV